MNFFLKTYSVIYYYLLFFKSIKLMQMKDNKSFNSYPMKDSLYISDMKCKISREVKII